MPDSQGHNEGTVAEASEAACNDKLEKPVHTFAKYKWIKIVRDKRSTHGDALSGTWWKRTYPFSSLLDVHKFHFPTCSHQSYHLCPTDPPLWCGPYSFSPLCPCYLGKIKGLACLWGEQKLISSISWLKDGFTWLDVHVLILHSTRASLHWQRRLDWQQDWSSETLSEQSQRHGGWLHWQACTSRVMPGCLGTTDYVSLVHLGTAKCNYVYFWHPCFTYSGWVFFFGHLHKSTIM